MKKKAFTLVELLVVVAVLGLLATIGVVAYKNISEAIKEKACRINREAIEHAIRNEEKAKGVKIYSLDDIAYFYPVMPKCPFGGHYVWIDRIDKVSCSHEIRKFYGVVYQYNEDMEDESLFFNGHSVENVAHSETYNLSEGGTIHVAMKVYGSQNPWAGIVHKGNKANTDESYSFQLLGNRELAICLKTDTPNTYNGKTYGFVVLQTDSNFFTKNEDTSVTATWTNESGKKAICLYKNGELIQNTQIWLYNFPSGNKVPYTGQINDLNLRLLDNEGDLLIGNQDVNGQGTAAFKGEIKTVNIVQGAMGEEEILYHLSRYNPE